MDDGFARVLAETHGSAVLCVGADGRPLLANRAFATLVPHWSQEDGEAWRALVVAEDRARLDAELEASLSAHGRARAQVRLSPPDGHLAWWTVEVRCVGGVGRDGADESRQVGAHSHGRVTVLTAQQERVRPADDAWREYAVLTEAQRIAQVGAWDWDITTGALWWSDEVYRIFGLPPQEFPATYEGFLARVHPGDRDEVERRVALAVAGTERYDLRHRVLRPDGAVRYVREQGAVWRDEGGAPVRMLGTVLDVTEDALEAMERERARKALADSESRYRLLAENVTDVVVQLDATGAITWVSDSVATVLGWLPGEVVGADAMELVHPDDRDRLRLGSGATDRYAQQPARVRARGGAWRWMGVSVRTVGGRDAVTRVLALRDIHQEQATRRDLEHALGHDPLTGLSTRDRILDRAQRALDDASTATPAVGVLCVGVDGLARVNDALTHSGGDVLLTTVAARIASVVPEPDLLARGSGDEFVVVLPGLAGGEEAAPLAEAIRSAALGPVQIDGHSVSASVSVGIATGGQGDTAVQLLRDASVAMRAAKSHGRDRIEFADEGVAAQAERRLVIEQEIRWALAEGRFTVWLQPIVSLHTRAVVGQEALVRAVRRDGSVAAPASFLPVAERLGLVVEIDDFVLRTALDLLTSLPREQYLSVNVAAASLVQPGYVDRVAHEVVSRGVDPTRLHLEVTETSLLRISDDVRDGMQALAGLGVRWYVDDFGTGYSSIAHLRDLPVSGLKLDLSFTRGAAERDATSVRLAQALAGLADGLELDSVAEGIETADVAALLRAQGWRHGQGWLFGRPVPSGDVTGHG